MTCVVADCAERGEWHVLRTTVHSPPHGFIHAGSMFAPYRVSHQRQEAKCLPHAQAEVKERNDSVDAD